MISQLGKLLIFAGIVMLVLGVLFYWNDKIPWLGKLPGDILVKKKNFTFYFPIVTCLVISLILTLLFFVFNRLK
jgi:hypothetical protein